MSFRRIAGLAGIAFVVLIVVNIALSASDMPSLKDSTEDVVRYYQDNTDKLRVAAVLSQLAGVFVAVFAAGVLTSIWRAERNPGRAWAFVGLIGIVAAFTAFDSNSGAHGTLLVNADSLGDDGLTRALFDQSSIAFAAAGFNLGVYLLGVGAGVLTTRVLPTWLGWGALVGALAGFVSGFGWGDRDSLDGFTALVLIANILTLAFTLIAGIIMATSDETAVAAASAAP